MNDLEKMKTCFDELKISYDINVFGLLSNPYQSLFLHYYYCNTSFNFDKDGNFLEIDVCE